VSQEIEDMCPQLVSLGTSKLGHPPRRLAEQLGSLFQPPVEVA
jgi:hypothetical protein